MSDLREVKIGSDTQADWMQDDPTKASYIRNKIQPVGGYEVDEPEINIVYDGDPAGKIVVDGYLVKVSDEFYTKEQLIGANYNMSFGSNTIKSSDFYGDSPDVVDFADYMVLFVNKPTNYNGTQFPESGTYWGADGPGYIKKDATKKKVKIPLEYLDLEGSKVRIDILSERDPYGSNGHTYSTSAYADLATKLLEAAGDSSVDLEVFQNDSLVLNVYNLKTAREVGINNQLFGFGINIAGNVVLCTINVNYDEAVIILKLRKI